MAAARALAIDDVNAVTDWDSTMFDAQLLIADTTAYTVFSPWFPRGGDNLTATLDIIKSTGATVEVRVYTKNSETSGPGTDADTAIFAVGSARGQFPASWTTGGVTPGTSSLLELARYQFDISGTEGSWVLFRMLAPVWFDEV